MSLDTLKSAEDEVSKLREENKILKKKLDYFTLMERSIRNLGSICGDGNEADWNTTFPNASTLQALQQQVNELKEELERTKERLQSVIKTNIVLNDAHDRKHQESEALKEEMEKSWGKFEETYTSQRQEMSKVEEGSRKLANENDVLKLQNKELALRLSAAEQLINFM
jgi:regulator of replication initiation timing